MPICHLSIVDKALETIIARFRSAPERNLIVGISGIDGSGKSTLAQQIESALARLDITAAQVNLDDLLNPKSIRHKSRDQIRGYFEDNFDFASLVNKVLDPARKAARFATLYPVLNLDTDQRSTREFAFHGPGVLLVEGVFLFKKELRDKFDLKVWIEIPFEDAMDRVVARTRDERYGDGEAIRARYETRFFPTQRYHLERDRPAEVADIVLRCDGRQEQ